MSFAAEIAMLSIAKCYVSSLLRTAGCKVTAVQAPEVLVTMWSQDWLKLLTILQILRQDTG